MGGDRPRQLFAAGLKRSGFSGESVIALNHRRGSDAILQRLRQPRRNGTAPHARVHIAEELDQALCAVLRYSFARDVLDVLEPFPDRCA